MNNTIECRYVADRAQWQSWEKPSDKGNSRAQLRRMINEWQDYAQILSELATIHPDPRTALAKVLQAHELMNRATVTVAIAAPPSRTIEPAKEVIEDGLEFDFEESIDC